MPKIQRTMIKTLKQHFIKLNGKKEIMDLPQFQAILVWIY